MSKLHFKTLFLISLAAALLGCEPNTPAQEPAASPAVAPPRPAAAAMAPAAAVSSELQLAEAHKCFACHALDRKVVGPAWKDVAAKYRGQKGAEAKLTEKVAQGGSGVWGAVPMPPNAPQVSQADIKTLVHYILNLK